VCSTCALSNHLTDPLVSATGLQGFKGILDVIERVYTGSLSAVIDRSLWLFTAKTLYSGIEKGYGKKLIDVNYDSPDKAMLQSLRDNVYVFSAFKTEKELRMMTELLTTSDGKPKSKAKFISETLALHKEYDVHFLNAEYDNAIKSAQSAAQWVRIQEDKKALPYLRYSTVHDSRVRLEHKALDGVTLPVDDDFWNTYFPPNGWGCRCDVIQVDRGKLTDKSKIVPPDMLPMFKNNVGKEGIVFPEKHPYYETSIATKNKIHSFVKQNVPYKQMELKYEQFKTKKDNTYHVANTHVGDERKPNIAIAEMLSDKGHDVKLLHNNITDRSFFEKVMPQNALFPKHPDATIDGNTFEFKTNGSGRTETLKSEIFKAFKQAPNVLVRFDYSEDVERYVKGEVLARKKYLTSKNINEDFEVWVLQKGEIKIFKSIDY